MITKDKRKYDGVVEECKLIFLQKRNKYGVSWRQLRLQSHVDIILMKLSRLKPMTNRKDYSDLSKADVKSMRDQLVDTINYCNYLAQRLDEV